MRYLIASVCFVVLCTGVAAACSCTDTTVFKQYTCQCNDTVEIAACSGLCGVSCEDLRGGHVPCGDKCFILQAGDCGLSGACGSNKASNKSQETLINPDLKLTSPVPTSSSNKQPSPLK